MGVMDGSELCEILLAVKKLDPFRQIPALPHTKLPTAVFEVLPDKPVSSSTTPHRASSISLYLFLQSRKIPSYRFNPARSQSKGNGFAETERLAEDQCAHQPIDGSMALCLSVAVLKDDHHFFLSLQDRQKWELEV